MIIPGFKFRKHSQADIRSFSETKRDWKELTFPGEGRALDLGSHIGIFIYFSSGKCKKFLCVEPSLSSYKLLCDNVCMMKSINNEIDVETINAAVVPDHLDKKMLQIYEKENSETSNTTIRTRGRVGKMVIGVGIGWLCDHFRPTTIKCDIEGGEYGILQSILNCDSVVEIGIEFHRIQQKNYLEKAIFFDKKIVEKFGGSDSRVKIPVFNKKSWNTTAIYRLAK